MQGSVMIAQGCRTPGEIRACRFPCRRSRPASGGLRLRMVVKGDPGLLAQNEGQGSMSSDVKANRSISKPHLSARIRRISERESETTKKNFGGMLNTRGARIVDECLLIFTVHSSRVVVILKERGPLEHRHRKRLTGRAQSRATGRWVKHPVSACFGLVDGVSHHQMFQCKDGHLQPQ